MRDALVAVVVVCPVLLAGCAGSGVLPVRGAAAPSPDVTELPSAVDSLRVAEGLYRQALGYYVTDQMDEAEPLLERALSSLEGAEPRTQNVRDAGESLRARVLYFLSMLPSHSRVQEKARPGREPARVDTTVVRSPSYAAVDASAGCSIDVVRNSRVDKWIGYFTGKGKTEMSKWLARSGRYRPMIQSILSEEGLPPELFYLAMIESGLNPNAYSRANAAGMWQFISSRGRMYGLRVDWWVDERRDPEKSTRAACAYLRDLYGMFGSWELALAGYNSGEGRVSKAQRRRPSCPDFWCLDLPSETENFVPKFMAAIIIGSDPAAYGFEPCRPESPLAYETVEVDDATDLETIADAAGVSDETIKTLNPAIRRWCTPPIDGSVEVRVPPGTGTRCQTRLASIPPEERVTWRRHQISRGETLSGIASAYGTSLQAIMSVNAISNPHRIRSGDYLIIPVGPDTGSHSYASISENVTYRVRRGDTITSIARRYGKRTQDVLKWNGLGWHSRIYPGDVITIRNM
jgi:membrane-bound lytic murein transglycosylase D